MNPLNYELKEKIFVCISRWQSFKNVENLVKGYALALGVDANLPKLVLVGKNHGNSNSLVIDLISSMQLRGHIITLHDLKDEELAFLLDNAEINITPSLYEGFGLSVLEGMKRGCPSLDHKYTSTSEISGAAGIHIDMTSVSEISNSLLYIKQNPIKIEEIRSRTEEISNKFTWQNTVNDLINVINKIDHKNIV